MKKKLLFVIPSLGVGGAEKSLTTLLQLLDPSQYDVDLYLFRREGLFLSLLPPHVRVLDAGETYRRFDGPVRPSLLYFLRHGKLLTALRRIRYARIQKLHPAKTLVKSWQCLAKILPKPDGMYDTAIGYLEGPATYFAVDCVRSEKTVAFLHTDYNNVRGRQALDAAFYAKLDTLISVSEECCAKAVAFFPFLAGRTVCMHNITSPTLIRKMAQAPAAFPPHGSGTVLVTVGRIAEVKGTDLAVQACALLMREGLDFYWYHIGNGPLKPKLDAMAQTLGVQERFLFLGETINPYPFIRACDIFVQPSRLEGKSIAVDEAKCLAKPIVVTDFDTVFDQITDGVNGVIVQKTPQAIADGIRKLIESPALRDTLTRNLQAEKVGTEEEIDKFCALV